MGVFVKYNDFHTALWPRCNSTSRVPCGLSYEAENGILQSMSSAPNGVVQKVWKGVIIRLEDHGSRNNSTWDLGNKQYLAMQDHYQTSTSAPQ